jgi:(p)ppGpp synthase/HD superfamily hydrolase
MTGGVDDQGVPLPAGTWPYSERLIRAMAVAAQIHAVQKKRGTSVPYLSHLLGTCSIALDHGADEDEAIAALLHDAIEDGDPIEAAKATVGSFGPKVLRIVEGCSDSESRPKPPWIERKAAYIARIPEEDRSVLLVSASDKLHNTRAILSDLRVIGDSVWVRFNAPREQTLWYYRSLVTFYRGNPNHHRELVDELDRTVSQTNRLVVARSADRTTASGPPTHRRDSSRPRSEPSHHRSSTPSNPGIHG